MDLMTDNSLKSREKQDLRSGQQEKLARLDARRRKLDKEIMETKQKLDKIKIEIKQEMEVEKIKEDFAKAQDLRSGPWERFARLDARRRKLEETMETKQFLVRMIIKSKQYIEDIKILEDFAKAESKREKYCKVSDQFASLAALLLLGGVFPNNTCHPNTVIFTVFSLGFIGLALHFKIKAKRVVIPPKILHILRN